MDWIIHLLRSHPELAVFLTLGIGFFVGRIRVKKFSLGIVTSVLLVGVLIGQLDIPMGSLLKSFAFLLFLFAIGYKVGPQFFRGLKKDGLPQVYFAVVMSLFILLFTWGISILMGYGVGEAAGLLAGSQTISAVIGVAGDTINGLGLSAEDKQKVLNVIPVAYAVTYIFGTAGSAWVVASLGPKMMGGLEKVKQQCKELESQMGDTEDEQPGIIQANRPVVFRAYEVSNQWFTTQRNVKELEEYFSQSGKRIYVERMRKGNSIINDITPEIKINIGDEIVLTGRREYVIGEEEWIGQEVNDEALLDFPILVLPTLVIGHKRKKNDIVYAGKSVSELRKEPFMHGVSIRHIKRMGLNIPIFPSTVIDAGDTLELIGKKIEVQLAAKALGYGDPATNTTDVIYLSIGILLGGIIGALTLHLGGVPISLSTSGGALIAGLLFGWWRSHRPSMGAIPDAALWVFNNLGLNIFIAIVGISAGPGFIEGFREVGVSMFLIGAITTTVPLIFGMYIARYWFKFHPAIALGCCCGARTTTAAIGALQEALESETPTLGYTVTYAVGNTLLILWGVIIVLLCS